MYSNISLLFSAPIPFHAAYPLGIDGQPQLPRCAETQPDGDQHALHPRVALRYAHQHGGRLSRRVRLGRAAGRVRGGRNRRTCRPSMPRRLLLTSVPSPPRPRAPFSQRSTPRCPTGATRSSSWSSCPQPTRFSSSATSSRSPSWTQRAKRSPAGCSPPSPAYVSVHDRPRRILVC